MKVEAVFFDLDETLVSLDAEVLAKKQAQAWQEVAAEAGLGLDALMSSHRSVTPGVWKAAEARGLEFGERVDGLWLMLETFRQALRVCGCDNDSLAQRAFESYWANREGVIRTFDDVTATLGQLHGRVVLAVITNGPAITQLDKLQATGLDSYFDLVVASGDIGFAKPDAAIFRHALSGLGVSAASSWHIGDSLMHDVAGAHNAGLTSVWLNRAGMSRDASHPEPHHEVASLRQIPMLLTDTGFSMSKA